MPYRVVRNDVTSGGGHNSGYPIQVEVGPVFSAKADAQDEADFLNGYRFVRPGQQGSYEVRPVAVLSRAQAKERKEERERKAAASREEQARRLEEQAAMLRAGA